MYSDIIIESDLDNLHCIGDGHYLAHVLRYAGECSVQSNGKEHTLKKGDCAIFRAGHESRVIGRTKDFLCKVIYVSREVIEKSTPASNYGMKGSLSLHQDPIMHLTQEQQDVLDQDFCLIEDRLAHPEHLFHKELMYNKLQTMILDFFDIHASLEGTDMIANSDSEIVNKFIAMLNAKEYLEHRDVAYYASKLCISPKYLSESCKRVSSYPATYWINRFTALDISRQLRDTKKSLAEISEEFGFSSLAYFSRYVSKHLGEPPTSIRGN